MLIETNQLFLFNSQHSFDTDLSARISGRFWIYFALLTRSENPQTTARPEKFRPRSHSLVFSDAEFEQIIQLLLSHPL